jgi:ABC-2 type transport system ATP-binding protein
MTTTSPTESDTRDDRSGGPPAIVLDDVGKRFGDLWATRGMSLTVDRAEIVGLIGPSGCGKTTNVRMITGTYRPDEGALSVLDTDPWKLRAPDRQRLGYLPQQPVLFESLTLIQNLNYYASMNGVRLRRRHRLDEVLELVGLDGRDDTLVRNASGGMQRRLALAAALVHEPELLVLDEPTAGIDPILRARFWEHFRELAAGGTTIVVTTQYVGEAAQCDTVGLMDDGRLIHHSAPEGLVEAAYGGERIRLVTGRVVGDAELDELCRENDLESCFERHPQYAVEVIAAVPDAGDAIPGLLGSLQDRGIEVIVIEEVPIDYEDVFVELVESHRADDERPERAGSPDDADPPEQSASPHDADPPTDGAQDEGVLQ